MSFTTATSRNVISKGVKQMSFTTATSRNVISKGVTPDVFHNGDVTKCHQQRSQTDVFHNGDVTKCHQQRSHHRCLSQRRRHVMSLAGGAPHVNLRKGGRHKQTTSGRRTPSREGYTTKYPPQQRTFVPHFAEVGVPRCTACIRRSQLSLAQSA